MTFKSTYQAAYDQRRPFNLSDVNDLSAYAKAHGRANLGSRFTNHAIKYDNTPLNFLSGGYSPSSAPMTGILPTIEREPRTQNFVRRNYLMAGRRANSLERPNEENLESFIDSFKTSRSYKPSPREPGISPRRQVQGDLYKGTGEEFKRHPDGTRKYERNEESFQFNHEPVKRVQSPYSHVTRRASKTVASEPLQLPVLQNLDRASGVQSELASPRRRIAAPRHTMAMKDRQGNVIQWMGNAPSQRYTSVADFFDEKLRAQDNQTYRDNLGGPFEEEREKQISGTFGAEGGPLYHLASPRQQSVNRPVDEPSGRRERGNTDLGKMLTDRPQLYRNITSWRGDGQWGQSTYRSSFNSFTQNDLSETENLMGLPLHDVGPKTGLKNVVEVSTNFGKKRTAMFVT